MSQSKHPAEKDSPDILKKAFNMLPLIPTVPVGNPFNPVKLPKPTDLSLEPKDSKPDPKPKP